MPFEKDIPVKTVKRHLMCDCGGEYKSTGNSYMTYPPQYPHQCNNCGDKVTKRKMYPLVIHLPVEE